MIISLTAFVLILVSVVAQLGMTVLYAKEALTTPLGTYCRVKCTVAGLFYLAMASLLAWGLFNSEIDAFPD